MNTKHQPFQAICQGAYGDGTVEVTVVNLRSHGPTMCVSLEEGPVYITKKEAMEFFGLKENFHG